MTILRPYQQEARYQCNTLINAKRHQCLVISTGGGKTKTACKIIEDQISLGKRIFVLTPQVEIFNQWVIELHSLKPGTINDKGVTGKNKGVYVCMPLTLVNLLNYLPEQIHPDIIVTDECHHSAADSWEQIYDHFSEASRLGLTATPERTDGKGISHLYTEIVQTTTMKELIYQGNLVNPLTIVPEEYLNKVPIKSGDFSPLIQARLLGKAKIIGDVIEKYSYIFGGLPVLCACSTYEHAKQMTQAFKDNGWRWDHIHSKLPYNERKRMLREIRENKINGLCTVGIGTEGLDIPGLYGLIWLRRTISLTIFLQFTGRVLRPLPGKTHGIILDPVGNTFIHGLPEMDRNWSLKGREDNQQQNDSIKMKKCPCCGVMNNTENEECHFCGCLLDQEKDVKFRIPAIVKGNLIALNKEEIPQLKKQSEKKKEKQIKEDEKENDLIELSEIDKTSLIRKNIFKEKRDTFKQIVKDFL